MQEKRIFLNLVDQVSPVNFGIWHAAVASSEFLYKQFDIESWLVAPESEQEIDPIQFPFLKVHRLKTTSATEARNFFSGFDSTKTVVITHGAWQYPSRWGAVAKKMGFPWVYTPHGMLEPWSMNQKRWKKFLYFFLVEKRLAGQASIVRAVGGPESKNLERVFSRVVHIPNGIYPTNILSSAKPETPVSFLYLARLHHKKGVVPLAKAWLRSIPGNSPGFKLTIAGTDDGEQNLMEQIIRECPSGNLEFVGPQFGEGKNALFQKGHFYVLPSQSEGFPTSVVEAMGAGLIPIITEGCNFPEAFKNQVAIKTGTGEEEILQALNQAANLSREKILEIGNLAREFVSKNYLWSEIARLQAEAFSDL
jgi:glycosyltransferase involved in cell wall biosynthesis